MSAGSGIIPLEVLLALGDGHTAVEAAVEATVEAAVEATVEAAVEATAGDLLYFRWGKPSFSQPGVTPSGPFNMS